MVTGAPSQEVDDGCRRCALEWPLPLLDIITDVITEVITEVRIGTAGS